MNKKGDSGNMLMVFSFLFLLFVIGIGISAGVYLFYGFDYDLRQINADVLNFKVKNCIAEQGIENLKADFYSLCRLNQRVIEQNSKIKICIDKEDCFIDNAEFQIGSDFESCKFIGAEGNDAYGKCSNSTMKFQEKKIDIITVDNQKKRFK